MCHGGSVAKRADHDERAHLLRRVLALFPASNDNLADRAVRRRIEGVVISEELAAGERPPRLAESEGSPSA
jgi:hypothetical protein